MPWKPERRPRQGPDTFETEIHDPAVANEQLLRRAGCSVCLWGSNECGQLGFGHDTMQLTTPTRLDLYTKVRQIALGGMHTLLLLMDGTLWSFGVNDEGALGRETKWNEKTKKPVEEFDSTKPGRVYLPRRAATVKQIACSESASFALTADGVIYGWGTFCNKNDVYGVTESHQIAKKPTIVYHPARQSPAARIATGRNHVVAVLENGVAMSWGDGELGQLGRISERNSSRKAVRQRTMMTPTSIAGMKQSKVVHAFCGEYNTILETASGTYFSCGANHAEQLAYPTQFDSMPSDLSLLSKEAQIKCHAIIMTPTRVSNFDGLEIEDIALGQDHGIGRTRDGRVYSWGANACGVLGRLDDVQSTNARVTRSVPMEVDFQENERVCDIDCGAFNAGCVSVGGDIYTWGADVNEIMGHRIRQTNDLTVPKKLKRARDTSEDNFVKICFGGQHAAALSVTDGDQRYANHRRRYSLQLP